MPDFLKDVLLNVGIVDHLESIRRAVDQEAVGSLSCVLQYCLLESWLPLLTPDSLRAEDRLQLGSLLCKPVSDEVVYEKSIFVFALELLLAQTANRAQCLLLDPLKDLIFCLFVLAYGLDNAQSVGPSPTFKLLKSLQI